MPPLPGRCTVLSMRITTLLYSQSTIIFAHIMVQTYVAKGPQYELLPYKWKEKYQ
jgi:hypothetical protein